MITNHPIIQKSGDQTGDRTDVAEQDPKAGYGLGTGPHVEVGMPEIVLKGSDTVVVVDEEDRELVSQWEWEAVVGPNGTHAAARIGGRQVLMDEVVIWAALVQGAAVRPDGTLTGDRPHPVSPAHLRRKLEAVLRRRSLDEKIRELVEERNA